jgi:ABC-type transporter Mla subunit MlaD
MTTAQQDPTTDSTNRIIDSVRDAEKSALESVRRFVDTVNDALPDLGSDGPRRKIIDSAFKMTEQLVGTSSQLAEKIVKATRDGLTDAKGKAGSSK